jgi:hypothetical protein
MEPFTNSRGYFTALVGILLAVAVSIPDLPWDITVAHG